MKKNYKFILNTLISIIALSLFGCSTSYKGKYFVDSEYIISHASLSSYQLDTNGNLINGVIDIIYESDIKLNYINYKCDLYEKNKIIESFKKEVQINNLYSLYIPIKINKNYEHAKVICTGWSNENPEKFTRLNAKNLSEMKNCKHDNLINAHIESIKTNNKYDYMIINYNSDTVYNNFRFFYDNYAQFSKYDVKVCVDCGYYEII